VADLFYTILIVWVLWRIFGGSVKSTVYHKHQYEPPRRKEGEVTVSSTSKDDEQGNSDKGEYVDYEEIK
jgi:hypothetical protein